MNAGFDEDALVACVDLVGRTGATQFEIGYLNEEDDPAFAKHGARWWAHAKYRGNRIIVEDHAGPVEAADALARRLLTGAKCKCGKLVSLSSTGAMFVSEHMADGSTWTPGDASRAGQCRWTRMGKRWHRGCEPDAVAEVGSPPSRAERRAAERAARKAERRKGGA